MLPGARQRSALLLHETTQDAHPADDCQKGRPRSLGQSAQERRVAHATVPDDAHLVRPKWTTQVPYLCRHRGAILIAREALVLDATHPVSSFSLGTLKYRKRTTGFITYLIQWPDFIWPPWCDSRLTSPGRLRTKIVLQTGLRPAERFSGRQADVKLATALPLRAG